MWSTVASWAAIFALGIALTRYYNPQLFDKLLPSRTAESAVELPASKKQKHRKSKLDNDRDTPTAVSGSEGSSKKRKIVSAPISATVKATTVQGQQTTLPRDEDGDLSNHDFARQLAKAQAGTKLEKNQAPSKKDRRSAKATSQPKSAVESASFSTDTSSGGGRDADDDMSPSDTPPIGTPSTAQTSRAGDVSDMLEIPGAKPTTLRLTDVAPTKPKQAAKQFEQVLTKKQRQRQAKQEENKQMREEADRLHEAKKQQQLRTARMAAGTSNQTKATSFASAAQPNAWQKKPEVQPASSLQSQPLLDTFEPEPPKPNGAITAAPLGTITNGLARNENASAVKQELGSQKTEAMAASSREGRADLSRGANWADEVNEDAQEEWEKLLVENETWEAVTSKKSKKKGKRDTDSGSEASAPVARAQPATSGIQKSSAAQPKTMNRFASMDQLNGDAWEA